MSVFHEALKSGRITVADVATVGNFPRALRAAKRREATERNERTPYERRRAARRELATHIKEQSNG